MRELPRAIPAAKIPSAVEVILRAGARNRRMVLIVDEHHLIALPHPVILILKHSQSHSHQVPVPARLGKNVIVLSIETLQLVGIGIVSPIVGSGLVRRGLAVLRM